MTEAQFKLLRPGVLIESSGSPGRVYVIVRKTAYGWQVREITTGKLGKAVNASWWTELKPRRG